MAKGIKVESARAKSGKKGGRTTLKRRGPEFYSEISRKRKTFAGGRPRKSKLGDLDREITSYFCTVLHLSIWSRP